MGAGIVLVGGVFDLVDGVVARRQGRVTTFGGFLDSSLDRVVDMALLLGLVLHYAGRGAAPLAGLAALGPDGDRAGLLHEGPRRVGAAELRGRLCSSARSGS